MMGNRRMEAVAAVSRRCTKKDKIKSFFKKGKNNKNEQH